MNRTKGRKVLRGALGVFALALLMLVRVVPAEAATILRIRFSSSAERTRVVLDLDKKPEFTHRALGDPARILIEVNSGRFDGSLDPVHVGDGFVRRVRSSMLQDGRAQVVLDLESEASYDAFLLESPFRIVVDVKHGTAPPPAPKPKQPEPEPPRGDTPEAGAKKPAAVPPQALPPVQTGPWVVAVDAGHGGQDHGARYYGSSEKDITLELAKRVVESLNARPGFEAFLTRKGDYFIPLSKRWALAEEKNARIFISIHCNASKNASAKGTEVYFLSLEGASDQAARELAEAENAVDAKMGVSPQAPALEKILFDMEQTKVLEKSEILADICLERLFDLGTVYNRGVKQAGFTVLRSPRMPSILVEAAFISNQREHKVLKDGGWQKTFGRLLAEGLAAYRSRVLDAE